VDALTYFQLWMTRLMGLLPEIGHCTACGEALTPRGELHTLGDGIFCRCIATATRVGFRPTRGNCAAHVAGAGGLLCRRAMAATARTGPSPLYAASLGTAPGAQTALAEALARSEPERDRSQMLRAHPYAFFLARGWEVGR